MPQSKFRQAVARATLYTLLFMATMCTAALAQQKKTLRVGVPTILSGDLAVLGHNIERTVRTYQKRHLRHPIEFIFEDARKSSLDGLKAYQKLINVLHVDMLIGGTSSNGTIAGAPLVNSSKTVLITPLTGGSNIDQAGPYVFRIGNSDILNGYQQADLLIDQGINKVALLTELTEYTQDIAKFFRERFLARGGTLVFNEDFPPDLDSFKALIVRMNSRSPEALVMSTQTGLAFGIFLRELQELKGLAPSNIHTNFVAASNPDAHTAAGDAIVGVHYLAPRYDAENPRLKRFFEEYKEDHGEDPAIPFHTAGTFDALDMLQLYLDRASSFDREGFKNFLSTEIKEYRGLMGIYSFDSEGNADLGFMPAVIGPAKGH